MCSDFDSWIRSVLLNDVSLSFRLRGLISLSRLRVGLHWLVCIYFPFDDLMSLSKCIRRENCDHVTTVISRFDARAERWQNFFAVVRSVVLSVRDISFWYGNDSIRTRVSDVRRFVDGRVYFTWNFHLTSLSLTEGGRVIFFLGFYFTSCVSDIIFFFIDFLSISGNLPWKTLRPDLPELILKFLRGLFYDVDWLLMFHDLFQSIFLWIVVLLCHRLRCVSDVVQTRLITFALMFKSFLRLWEGSNLRTWSCPPVSSTTILDSVCFEFEFVFDEIAIRILIGFSIVMWFLSVV